MKIFKDEDIWLEVIFICILLTIGFGCLVYFVYDDIGWHYNLLTEKIKGLVH